MANPNWKPGVSGNPKGRIPGVPNKRNANEELFHRLKERGDRDPAEVLSKIASDANERKELIIQAAIGLMPYKYSKKGLEPQPAPLVYVAQPVELPHPHATEIRHAIENIEYLSDLRQTGKLDLAAADALISDQRLIRDGLIEEHKALIAQGGPPNQVIRIEGGMEPLPGTNIDFGSTAYGAQAAAFPKVVNGEAVRDLSGLTPPVPVIPHPQSPLSEKPGLPKHPVGDPDPGDKP
jgi:hypothetical protein